MDVTAILMKAVMMRIVRDTAELDAFQKALNASLKAVEAVTEHQTAAGLGMKSRHVQAVIMRSKE